MVIFNTEIIAKVTIQMILASFERIWIHDWTAKYEVFISNDTDIIAYIQVSFTSDRSTKPKNH